MKSVINQIAQRRPGLKAGEFETVYRAEHPAPETLSPDNVRQAFTAYNASARKIQRVSKGRDGTVGPDRIPR